MGKEGLLRRLRGPVVRPEEWQVPFELTAEGRMLIQRLGLAGDLPLIDFQQGLTVRREDSSDVPVPIFDFSWQTKGDPGPTAIRFSRVDLSVVRFHVDDKCVAPTISLGFSDLVAANARLGITVGDATRATVTLSKQSFEALFASAPRLIFG